MSKAPTPELKKYMDKHVQLQLNGDRRVTGILRGYDPFMNLVIDQAYNETKTGKEKIGMVVIRGNSVTVMECLDRVGFTGI